MDVILAYIHTQFMVTGAAGGFLHVCSDRKMDVGDAVLYMVSAILLANFIGPLGVDLAPDWLAQAPHGADGIGVLLGYGVSRVCHLADKRLDGIKPYEGPEHD